MRPIIVDLGEFYDVPVRTGIQRTVCELLSNWPREIPVRFVRYEAAVDGFISISDKAIAFLIAMFGSNALLPEQIAKELLLLDAGVHSERVYPTSDDKVLIPELFYRLDRVIFYRQAIRLKKFTVCLLVYDFLPWFKPDLYMVGPNMRLFMPFLQLAMEVDHRAYISKAVRDDFQQRIVRASPASCGPAVTLGADGIGLENQTFRRDRQNFICLGTFEAKKRHEIVFEAFRSLPPTKAGGKLQFLGKVPSNLGQRLQPIVDYEGLDVEVIDGPSDDEVRTYLRNARASFFISPNEGFGLPALETLYCGIPTVVSADLPSVSGLNDKGQIRLPSVDVDSVAAAMRQLRDDDKAAELWAAAANLTLPSWKEFADTLARWAVQC